MLVCLGTCLSEAIEFVCTFIDLNVSGTIKALKGGSRPSMTEVDRVF